MKKYISIIVLALAVLPLSAQSVPFVTITNDPVALSMGGASVATNADAFALSNNPAAMAMSDYNASVAASYGMWQPQMSKNTMIGLSGFGKIGDKLGVGASGRFFTHLPYDVTGENGHISGQYTPREYAVEVGAAYRIIKMLSVGVNLRYIGSDLGGEKPGNAFSADIAAMFRYKGLNVAASISNLGTKIDYGVTSYTLPLMAKVGAAYNLHFAESHRFTVSGEFDYLIYREGIMFGAGGEYSFKEMASIRAGYHYGGSIESVPSYVSAGLGVKLFGVALNAAYLLPVGDTPLKNTFLVSLGWSF